MGQVQEPGIYEIDTAREVVEVLAMAGGLTDMADHCHITIEPFGAAKQKVEYFSFQCGRGGLLRRPHGLPRRYSDCA